MTLLNEVMQRPLDPGYAAAARRRHSEGLPPMTPMTTPVLGVALLLVGLLFSTAVVVRNRDRPAAVRAASDLVAQIEDGRAAAEARSRQITALQQEVSRAQASASGADASRLAALEAATAALAVHGPGLLVTLDDAPGQGGAAAGSDPRGAKDAGEGKVLSRDVQVVVNSLWEAGAEAVAVNGQRLSPRSAIRFAGDAILVNFRPLTRPYTISAIGDPAMLPQRFGAGPGGQYLNTLSSNFGIVTGQKTAKDLSLPGATALTVRLARPVTPEASS